MNTSVLLDVLGDLLGNYPALAEKAKNILAEAGFEKKQIDELFQKAPRSSFLKKLDPFPLIAKNPAEMKEIKERREDEEKQGEILLNELRSILHLPGAATGVYFLKPKFVGGEDKILLNINLENSIIKYSIIDEVIQQIIDSGKKTYPSSPRA